MENYEVFISFKCNYNGKETFDKSLAEEIYKILTEKYNIKTFYSENELHSNGVINFTAGIDEALKSSTIFVSIATRKEFLESQWVAEEILAFKTLCLNNKEKFGSMVHYFSPRVNVTELSSFVQSNQTYYTDEVTKEEFCEFIVNALNRQKKQKAEYLAEIETKKEKSEISNELKKLHETPAKSFETRLDGTFASSYSATASVEYLRLKLQALNTRDADMPAIEYVKNHTPFEKYNIIDFGCAFGYVTKDRFKDFTLSTIIGVDINKKCIDFANENNDNDRFHFEVLDLEADDFDEKMNEIKRTYGIESFDIMFASLVVHHLKDPIRFLRRIRKHLSKDGYLIVRGSDDGSMVAYGDDGLVNAVVQKSLEIEGISDRYNGRKLYTQLTKSSYRDIKMRSYIKDLSNVDMDERNDIFKERFAYRIDYANRDCDRNPGNMEKIERRNELKIMLQKLENIFDDPEFWYCETDFVAIAKK